MTDLYGVALKPSMLVLYYDSYYGGLSFGVVRNLPKTHNSQHDKVTNVERFYPNHMRPIVINDNRIIQITTLPEVAKVALKVQSTLFMDIPSYVYES